MTKSEQPPLERNGRKKGYIKIMRELWDAKGYGEYGFSNQNLRDQAARLESELRKPQGECSQNATGDEQTGNSAESISSADNISRNVQAVRIDSGSFNAEIVNSDTYNIQDAESCSYANSTQATLTIDLHMTCPGSEIPGVTGQTEWKEDNLCVDNAGKNNAVLDNVSENDNNRENECKPGCLPAYDTVHKPSTINWGKRSDGTAIIISASNIVDAYNEIVTWRKNAFLVPYGKIGRDFIDQVTLHINNWNNGSDEQHVSLKAAFVLLAVGLQKPGPKSKAKDHADALSKRLVLWKEGEIHNLLREGRIIQGRIGKSKMSDPPDKSKVFAKLVLEGQINAALRFVSETSSGGVLGLTDDVMAQLKEKHPDPKPAKLGSLLFGPIDDAIPESLYSEINGEMVRQAALRTKGSGGPSGIDANGFRRMMASKSFKQSSSKLCDAIATMTKILCTHFIDPSTIEAVVASRLIPLDKGEGEVRPIGVGEVLRRIMGKCVMNVAKNDVVGVSGSLQLCAGQKSGSEAAIHAMHTIFESDETDAVLLIDASNAFNSLNRAAALHNVRVLCPIIAVYAINTYRLSSRLFITGGQEIPSAEGTTQGDPLAMGLYALSMQPLITGLQGACEIKQCWFADDASGAGSVSDIKKWWDTLSTIGPDFGYFPKAKKCWVITKPDKEDLVKEAFKETAVNVTTQGQKHLGAAIGSREYVEDYVSDKVSNWISEVTRLAKFAAVQPQACYAAYTFGLKHRWTYFIRTIPDIQDLLEPLENAISRILIPALTDRQCSQLDREILSLPVRLGGLGLGNPCDDAQREYVSSVKVTTPLVAQIVSQAHQLPDPSLITSAQQEVREKRAKDNENKANGIKEVASQKTQRTLELAAEKGSSAWLTVLPLKELGFNLNKRQFKDGVKLRYDWPIDDIPSSCVCGELFDVDHAMICKRGGFVIQRHNELRDLEAELINLVCSDVVTEPVLQDVSGEQLTRGSNTARDARLDIHARGFWEPQQSAFFDVRVCHPNAESYRDLEPQQIYRIHENEKKRQYASRVVDIEQGTFTPLVFTTTGGMGKECRMFHSRLAELIAIKKGEDYAKTISWIRARTSFALLRSALICLRGSRTVKRVSWDLKNSDIEIEATEGAIR